jgi:acyl carrier protein phosphodiesterase
MITCASAANGTPFAYLFVMNYLAHAYLSFGDEETVVGNLISDFVKGRKKFSYPKGIQKGIILHRAIDTYTDTHAATKLAKETFKPSYRLYSGAFVDVVYDHFLATDPGEFTESNLEQFSRNIYDILDRYLAYLPDRFAGMFPYMKLQNWLFNYRTRWGTESSFGGIVRRAKYLHESETACSLFEENYKTLQACYRAFFPDLKLFAQTMFKEIMKL